MLGWSTSPRNSRSNVSCPSRTMTSAPRLARSRPSSRPAGPPPTTQAPVRVVDEHAVRVTVVLFRRERATRCALGAEAEGCGRAPSGTPARRAWPMWRSPRASISLESTPPGRSARSAESLARGRLRGHHTAAHLDDVVAVATKRRFTCPSPMGPSCFPTRRPLPLSSIGKQNIIGSTAGRSRGPCYDSASMRGLPASIRPASRSFPPCPRTRVSPSRERLPLAPRSVWLRPSAEDSPRSGPGIVAHERARRLPSPTRNGGGPDATRAGVSGPPSFVRPGWRFRGPGLRQGTSRTPPRERA